MGKRKPPKTVICWCCGQSWPRASTENTIDPAIRVCRPCWQAIKRFPLSAVAGLGRRIAEFNRL